MNNPEPPRIARLVLNVPDLERSLSFYREALGFSPEAGSSGGVVLRLGDQRIELVEQRDGRPYPSLRAANDPWFQHFAIAVSDMDAAYAQLSAYGHEPISTGGPQQLPPSTGSVIAYKFRDPDGHPLELSYIPYSAWTRTAYDPNRRFLGIDHTGIAVADLAASIAFYRSLGFRLQAQGFNTGPEQDRLDGLDGVQLDIGVMKGGDGPHIELLHYRTPQPASEPCGFASHDIASTRIMYGVAEPPAAEPALIQDPDGHWLQAGRNETLEF